MRGNIHKLSILSRITGGGSGPPSSGLYERLEGGGQRDQKRVKAAWTKFAVGAVVLIGIVWLFGPRERRARIFGSDREVSTPYETVPPHHVSEVDDDELMKPPPHQVSYETDPDRSKSIFCVKSYSPSKPLVQWALMVDAGSTGSRIHAYKFNNCGPSPQYEYEAFNMTRPGLSSYPDSPEKAAESLDILMDLAMRAVPTALQKCTPVAVKATAGLRLLGRSRSDAILDAVKHRLNTIYPFPIVRKDGVVIMDGKDEGVYAWITVNYLLDSLKATTLSSAVLDLGGGSTQIVFEPSVLAQNPVVEGEHKYTLSFGSEHRELYQHSYLGYGLMSARTSVHRLVEFMHTLNFAPNETEESMTVVHNPCIAKGMHRDDIELPIGLNGAPRNVTMDGADIGSFEACRRVVELVMAKDAVCQVKPCSFGGVYQPSLLDSFANGKVVLLSYFYDRVAPLLPIDGPTSGAQPTLTVGSLALLAQHVCGGETSWQKHWGSNKVALEELRGRPEYCLDLTFQHALLRLGYEFEDDRPVKILKKLRDTELGWCLGATMVMLHGDLQCRV